MNGSNIRIKLKRACVFWSEDPVTVRADWHGFSLFRPNRDASSKIIQMLRRAPKKHNPIRGHVSREIFKLPEVSASWY